MRRILRGLWQDERGVSLAIIALTLTTLLSLLAFSLDLGLLYTARAEAQRAADAAALAGASAFLNFPADMQGAAASEAEQRAQRYASLNRIRGRPPSNVAADANRNGGRSATVTVRQDTVALWFARLLGVEHSAVEASATASAVPARTADCVAPFSFDANDIEWDWSKHGADVSIAPVSSEPGPPADHEFLTLHFVDEWEDSSFRDCASDGISIDQAVPTSGYPPVENLWAQNLMSDDPGARWNPETQRVENESGEPAWNSPRIITVMLHGALDDAERPVAGDFLLFFIEDAAAGIDVVDGRFLAYASGTGTSEKSQTMLAVQLTR